MSYTPTVDMTSLSETATIVQQHEDASGSLESIQVQMELQIELQNAIALCSSIKSENTDLKQQLSDANAFSAANLQRHSKWKESWKKERELVLQREKNLARDEAKWKINLEERRNELDELERKQMLNSVGSGTQLGLLKDMESDYASKTNRLGRDVSQV